MLWQRSKGPLSSLEGSLAWEKGVTGPTQQGQWESSDKEKGRLCVLDVYMQT